MVEYNNTLPDDTEYSGDPELTVKSSVVPEAPSTDYGREDRQVSSSNTSKPDVLTGQQQAPRASRIPPPPSRPRNSVGQVRPARRRQARRRSSGADWAWVVIAIAIFGVVIVLGFTGMMLLRSFQTDPEVAVLPTASADPALLPTPVDFRITIDQQFEVGEVVTLENGYSLVLEKWDGESRFTLLAMGLDRRPDEIGLEYRTDTMMLMSIDPATKSIGILSIPRDLWVVVPGYATRFRVNSPMYLGEISPYTTGPDLAMRTVQSNLGIRIHNYLLVDFQAVIDFVNAIGGIDVSIDYTINDQRYPDMNYGYETFYLEAGTHHLEGYDALRFARTRHGSSDIDRAARQQQVIFSVRDQVLDLNMLPQLIFQAPTLLNSFQDNVYTDLSLDQMIELALYVKDIPRDNITTGVINFDYLQPYENPDGQQVLIPIQWRLGELMAQVFGPNYAE
jgi:polyisoprenyl-teichoic acid--peptidoglycan teichoic acid transferase